MVKFAEAEKRGRGGEGSDRRYTPVVMVERAKINRAMWESLKAHIIRERKRKKEGGNDDLSGGLKVEDSLQYSPYMFIL